MLLWNVRDSFGHFSETDEAWIIDKYTQILPFREVPLDTIHVFEAYSGGYGGWKFACEALSRFYDVKFQTIALDNDLRTCLQYAVTHNALLIEATQGKPKFDLTSYGKKM